MHIVWTILIGLVVGLLARFLTPGEDKMGLILTAALGIGGSLVATYVGQAIGWYTAGQGAGFIASLLGAIVLLAIVHLVRKKSA
ncbi:MAG TPA: GlsB/YeaQ/YmgE family stress response membrane protein [Burkholderiaceae bacterium]|nr:GlsB/YeaQ/YmgE family stress response membrane protein [Burkholderiaceae bacterium]